MYNFQPYYNKKRRCIVPFSSLQSTLKKLSYSFILFAYNELFTQALIANPAGFEPCEGLVIPADRNSTSFNALILALEARPRGEQLAKRYHELFSMCTKDGANPLHFLADTDTPDKIFAAALTNAPNRLVTKKDKSKKSLVDILIKNKQYGKIAILVEQISPKSTQAHFFNELALAIEKHKKSPHEKTEAEINLIKLSLLTHFQPVTKTEKKLLKWATQTIAEHPDYKEIAQDVRVLLNDYENIAKHSKNDDALQLLRRKRQVAFKANTMADIADLTLLKRLQKAQGCYLYQPVQTNFMKQLMGALGTHVQRSLFSDRVGFTAGYSKYHEMLEAQSIITTTVAKYSDLPYKTHYDSKHLISTINQSLTLIPIDPDYAVTANLALSAKTQAHLETKGPRAALETFLDSVAFVSNANPFQDNVFRLCLEYRQQAFSVDERLLLLRLFLTQPETVCPDIDRAALSLEYLRDLVLRSSAEPLFEVYNALDEHNLRLFSKKVELNDDIIKLEIVSARIRQDSQGNVFDDSLCEKDNTSTGLLIAGSIFSLLLSAIVYYCDIHLTKVEQNKKDKEAETRKAETSMLVLMISMELFVTAYFTEAFSKSLSNPALGKQNAQTSAHIRAEDIKETVSYCHQDITTSFKPDRQKLAAFISKQLRKLGEQTKPGQSTPVDATNLFQNLVFRINNYLIQEHKEQLQKAKIKTKTAPTLASTFTPISAEQLALEQHIKTLQALKQKAESALATHLLTRERATAMPARRLDAVAAHVEGFEQIPEIKRQFDKLKNATEQFTTYIRAQSDKYNAYQTARDQLEAALTCDDLALLQKAFSHYETKALETESWINTREVKLNKLPPLNAELKTLVAHRRKEQAAAAAQANKDNPREQEALQKHEAFLKKRAEDKAAKLAEKEALQFAAARIPLNDDLGEPLMRLEALLMQLNRFQEDAHTLSQYITHDALCTQTLHLAQQIIYLQLFNALLLLSKTALADKFPPTEVVNKLRNKFAHANDRLSIQTDWATFAELTVAAFLPVTTHYLYLQNEQMPPAAAQVPNLFSTLFTAKNPTPWKTRAVQLQHLYLVLRNILNRDDTIAINSPICNAMRMIIVQLNEVIRPHEKSIRPTDEMSMLVNYRNREAHPDLQSEINRETLLNLKGAIRGIHVKQSLLFFAPAPAEFDSEPAPQPLAKRKRSRKKH